MLEFLAANFNLPTVLVAGVIVAWVVFIRRSARKAAAQGKHTCSCGNDCASCGCCQSK